MGFKELNTDRQFSINGSDEIGSRQLDVIAKDDETVFIVEMYAFAGRRTQIAQGTAR
jgi:hypothetical protein